MSARRLNLTGTRFGKWTVVSPAGSRRTPSETRSAWLCRCDCGTERVFNSKHISLGKTNSCGCERSPEIARSARERFTTHGFAGTVIGNTWSSMMFRCFNPNAGEYHRYGGRGITVCEFLRATPANLLFLIGDRPSDSHSLDRKDNSGSYTCGQCRECMEKQWVMNIRWALPKEQSENSAQARLIEINGEVHCVRGWSHKTGISSTTLANRLERGLTGAALLAKPLKRGGNMKRASDEL